MKNAVAVTCVHFHPAAHLERVRGLLGWASLEAGGLHVDAIAVRRTLDGRIALSFPERTDRRGRRRPIARPMDDVARESIESQVIEALTAQGYLQ